MSRRTLRTATRPSSAMCLTTFTYSLRRSSVSGGNARRMTVPSLLGAMPEVAVADGLLDGAHRVAVVGPDDEQPGLGHAEAGQLLERDVGPVVVDEELLDQRRGGPAGAHRGELPLHVLDRLVHLVDGVEQVLFDHPTSVPTRRPSSTDRTLPLARTSNTTIGMPLSMQKVMAVESITFRPRLITSM